MGWKQYNNGAKWFVADDGRIKVQGGLELASDDLERYLELDDEGFIRTEGKPLSALKLDEQHGDKIRDAAARFSLKPELLAGLILCESGRLKGTYERDLVSERKERGFISWHETPKRGSAGLGQQLLSTARAIVKYHKLERHFLDPEGFEREVEVGDLIVSYWGITLLGGYLAMLIDSEKTDDPFLLSCAYNSGGVYPSSKNNFGVRCNGGNDRLMKHAAYSNDWLAATV